MMQRIKTPLVILCVSLIVIMVCQVASVGADPPYREYTLNQYVPYRAFIPWAQIPIDEINRIGDAGVAVAQLITLVIFAMVLYGLARLWIGLITANRAAESDKEKTRQQNERDQTAILKELKDAFVHQTSRQAADHAMQESLAASVTTLALAIDSSFKRVEGQHVERARQFTEIASALGKVPAEVWIVGDPRLAQLRELITQSMTNVENTIRTAAHTEHEGTRLLLAQEIHNLKKHFDQRLDAYFAQRLGAAPDDVPQTTETSTE